MNNANPVTSNHHINLTEDIQALVQQQQQQQNASVPSNLIEQHLVQSQLNQQIQLQNQVAAVVAATAHQLQPPQQQSRQVQFSNQGINENTVLQPSIILQEQLSPRQNNSNQLHMGEMIF